MVEELPPHGHGAVRHEQAGQRPGGEGVPDDVLRQKRKPHAALDHLAEQGGAAQFEVGVDGQLVGGKGLVQRVAVAHAPLGQQKFLVGQLFQRHALLRGQRADSAGATKQIASGTSSASTRLG